jgi:hypothetical protein
MARKSKKAAETTNVGGAQIENTAIEAARAAAEDRADTLVQEMHDDPKPTAEPTYDELKAKVAELEGQLAAQQNHLLWTSSVQKPVARVREIFCEMFGSQRKDVIAACVNAGIAANTAKTQYQILKGKAERGELDELLEEQVREQEDQED